MNVLKEEQEVDESQSSNSEKRGDSSNMDP
jgi:hypothetical protein